MIEVHTLLHINFITCSKTEHPQKNYSLLTFHKISQAHYVYKLCLWIIEENIYLVLTLLQVL